MDFVTYQQLALRSAATSPSPSPHAFQLLQGCVGLVGELNELLGSPTFDRLECGDVWWYLAQIARALGKPYEGLPKKGAFADKDLQSRRQLVSRCFQRSLIMLEMAKKVYFQHHDLERHASDLYVMAASTASNMAAIDDNVSRTWKENVRKLADRYPGHTFDAEASMARKDVET